MCNGVFQFLRKDSGENSLLNQIVPEVLIIWFFNGNVFYFNSV